MVDISMQDPHVDVYRDSYEGEGALVPYVPGA